jgi:hypothetical protein
LLTHILTVSLCSPPFTAPATFPPGPLSSSSTRVWTTAAFLHALTGTSARHRPAPCHQTSVSPRAIIVHACCDNLVCRPHLLHTFTFPHPSLSSPSYFTSQRVVQLHEHCARADRGVHQWPAQAQVRRLFHPREQWYVTTIPCPLCQLTHHLAPPVITITFSRPTHSIHRIAPSHHLLHSAVHQRRQVITAAGRPPTTHTRVQHSGCDLPCSHQQISSVLCPKTPMPRCMRFAHVDGHARDPQYVQRCSSCAYAHAACSHCRVLHSRTDDQS